MLSFENKKAFYAEYRYVECRYAECRGAKFDIALVNILNSQK
jgi:hypothetical protein